MVAQVHASLADANTSYEAYSGRDNAHFRGQATSVSWSGIEMIVAMALTSLTSPATEPPWLKLFRELCVDSRASLAALAERASISSWRVLPSDEIREIEPDDTSIPFGAWRFRHAGADYVAYAQGAALENGARSCALEVFDVEPDRLAEELSGFLDVPVYNDRIIENGPRMLSWTRDVGHSKEVFFLVAAAGVTVAPRVTVYMTLFPNREG